MSKIRLEVMTPDEGYAFLKEKAGSEEGAGKLVDEIEAIIVKLKYFGIEEVRLYWERTRISQL